MHATTRLALAAVLALGFVPLFAGAQDKPAEPESSPSSGPKEAKPDPQPYTLNVSVKESNGGKLVQEKNYTLTVIADDRLYSRENLRDGERIPYQRDKDQNYQNVGTNIDTSEASRRGDALVVTFNLNSSAMVATPNYSPGNLPEISEWSLHLAAVLLPGKPTIVYSTTDAIANHKVEIQATATPLNAR